MAIKVVKKNFPFEKYEIQCPLCKTRVQYMLDDVKYHRRFPEGYIYCPNCRRPMSHSTATAIELDKEKALKEAEENAILVAYKYEKQLKKNTISGVIFFIISALCLILSVVLAVVTTQVIYLLLLLPALILLVIAIAAINGAACAKEQITLAGDKLAQIEAAKKEYGIK